MTFDPSKPGYYNRSIGGGGAIDTTFHWTSHSFMGATYNDGKEDALNKVKSGLNAESLGKKVTGWKNVASHTDGVATKLSTAYTDTFTAWQGDDADAAQASFSRTLSSAQNMATYSDWMHTGTKQIHDGVVKLVGSGDSSPDGWDKAGNIAIGGNIFGGDGDKALNAYEGLMTDVGNGQYSMPSNMEWQVKKADPVSTDQGGNHTPEPGGGGVGGVGTPHASGAPQHLSANTGSIPGSGQLPHGTNPDPIHGGDPDPIHGGDPYDPPISSPIHDPHSQPIATPIHGGGGGIGGGGGYDPPSLDTGSSLAGLNPGGGGVGGGAGVGGGFGTGGAGGGLDGSGLGAGAAGSGLAGGGLGAGAGAGGAGAAGAGAAGAGKAGASGMMAPMRGGAGGGGNDDERERNTWLTEDEDVWGDSDAPPAVIS